MIPPKEKKKGLPAALQESKSPRNINTSGKAWRETATWAKKNYLHWIEG